MRLLGLKVNESFSIVTTVHVLKVVTMVSFELVFCFTIVIK